MKQSTEKLPLYAIFALTLGIIIRLIIIFTAPIDDISPSSPYFNDERSHLNHVLFRSTFNRSAPQRFDSKAPYAIERGELEYSQPPLYYMIASGLIRICSSVIVLRLFSFIVWLLALWIILRHLPSAKMAGVFLLAGGLLGAGMVPSTTINNDSLLALIVACIYAHISSSTQRGTPVLSVVILGMLTATGIWTKLSALTLIPMVVIAIYYTFEGGFSRKLKYILLYFAILTWMTLPMWSTRITVYGTPFSITASTGFAEFKLREAITSICYSLVSPWMGYWSSYFVKIPAIILVIILFVSGIVFLKSLILKREFFTSVLRVEQQRLLLIWLTGSFFTVVAYLFYGFRYFQLDARLLIPAAPGLAVMFGFPLWTWSKKSASLVGWLLTILLLIPYIALLAH
ncbi:hypothetical protein ACFLQJ_00435 [Calditrichota bacterium]